MPCNVDVIEAVYLPGLPIQESSSCGSVKYYNSSVEYYNESQKRELNPFYNRGHLAKYRIEGDSIVFDKDYNNVTVMYHGVILDEDGLPYLTDKEVKALASYVAYVETYKKGLVKQDGNIMNFANMIKAEWTKLCSAARIPDHITQNDVNDVLDVKTRWDRKMYGKSFSVLK